MKNKTFFLTYCYGIEIGLIEFDDESLLEDERNHYDVSGYNTIVRSYDKNDPIVEELRKHYSYKNKSIN